MTWLLILSLFLSDPVVEVVHLDDLEARLEAGRDTVYVVNFWATWCKPCLEEMPAFDKVHRQNKDSLVKVLMVSLDDVDEVDSKVVSLIKKKGLSAEVVLLDEDHPNEWIDRVDESWSGAIPATLIVEASTGRRQFFEREFTFEQLQSTLNGFRGMRK